MNSVLTGVDSFAMRYLSRGISVIPLSEKSKTPSIPWRDFQNVRMNEEEVEDVFKPNSNIGIVTGAISGLVVVDLDGPEGIKTAESMGLTSTVIASTGKGRHLYFKHPGYTVANATRIAPGVDIRGDGGYVVAPPSTHESGRKYEWVATSKELPPYPVDKFSRKTEAKPTRGPGWVAEALSSMSEGNRNSTSTRLVGKLHRAGFNKDDIFAILSPKCYEVDLPQNELKTVIESITRKPSGASNELETIPALGSFFEADESVEWLVPDVISRSSIGFIAGLPATCKTWASMDLAIELSRGGNWLGKFPTNPGRVLYIDQERYAGETRRRFKALIEGKGITYKSLEDNLAILCGTTIRVDLEHSYQSLRRQLGEFQPDLIVVDSFVTFHTKEENNRTEIQPVLERIKAIRDEFKSTVLFIDHENKGAYKADEEGEQPSMVRMAGSIAKPSAAEFIFTVRSKGPGRSAFHLTKNTLGPSIDPFFVEVRDMVADRSKIEVVAC